MDARTFDNLTRKIAGRMSRRRALAAGGLGITGAVLGRDAGSAFVQGATPVSEATPVTATSIDVLYVQTFSRATIQQDANDPGAFTITLEGSTGQTVYFSDRPERIVGTLTDEAFVDGRAFDPADPPNAAIVTITGDGEQVLVVELTEPAYDAATGTVSYAAMELQGQPEGDVLASLAARQTGADMGDSLGPVTLFIDQLTCAPIDAPCTQNSDCCSGDCCPFTTCINRTCE
jgi:hypothetical protein